MLNIQYDKINTIDDIVNHAEIAVDQASTELVKTVEIRKKSRKVIKNELMNDFYIINIEKINII